MARPINLKKFEKYLVVRALRPEDWESVVALEQRCCPGMETWTKEQFDGQLAIFPEGQIGVEYQGKPVASSSSLILDFEMYKDWHNLDAISDNGHIRNHTANGSTLYGIEMMVDPAFRGLKLAGRLYDARKRVARDRNLMRIVVGGRIPGYAQRAAEMTARAYIDKVMSKTLHDSVLTAQLANGFVLKRLIPGYMTMDVESRGYAAFLEWANVDYVPNPGQRFIPVSPARVCVVQYQMRHIADFAAFANQCASVCVTAPRRGASRTMCTSQLRETSAIYRALRTLAFITPSQASSPHPIFPSNAMRSPLNAHPTSRR
jgi:ribosomal protein S18 acetylase RimI-like enzyme